MDHDCLDAGQYRSQLRNKSAYYRDQCLRFQWNRRRTTIDYGTYAQWGLPDAVREYAADGLTEIRQTFTDYNLSPEYVAAAHHRVGFIRPCYRTLFDQSKTTFTYDDPSRLHAVPSAATQHDSLYNTSFTARGNVTAVSRWDVEDITNAANKLTSLHELLQYRYRQSTHDPADHQSSISYADRSLMT